MTPQDPRQGAQVLGRLPIFKGFSEKELIDVYCLGEIRVYKPSSHIVIEGENSTGLYVILGGHTAVFKSMDGEKGSARIAVLQEGSAFGELSLVDQSPRSATVVAEGSAVTTFFLDGKRWRESLEYDLGRKALFYENCAHIMAHRLRELDDSYLASQRQLWRHVFSKRA